MRLVAAGVNTRRTRPGSAADGSGRRQPGHSVRAALLDLLPGGGQLLLRRLRRKIRSSFASSGEALDECERRVGLFHKALVRYAEGPSAYERKALEQPTAREVAESLLRGAADLQTDPHSPAGCLAVLGTTTCAEDSSPIGKALIAFRLAGEAAIRERFERARAEGDLSPETEPQILTDYLRTVVYGMAVKAASGATRDDLERVIDHAMRAWPH